MKQIRDEMTMQKEFFTTEWVCSFQTTSSLFWENILHPFFSKLTLKVLGHLKILSTQKQTALSGGLFSA